LQRRRECDGRGHDLIWYLCGQRADDDQNDDLGDQHEAGRTPYGPAGGGPGQRLGKRHSQHEGQYRRYMQQRRLPMALPGRHGEQHDVASLSVGEHPSATDERVGVQEPARAGQQQASGQVFRPGANRRHCREG
jgi:hypothetical protein